MTFEFGTEQKCQNLHLELRTLARAHIGMYFEDDDNYDGYGDDDDDDNHDDNNDDNHRCDNMGSALCNPRQQRLQPPCVGLKCIFYHDFFNDNPVLA